jgi:SAM-dependent MidA family methyltransferase
MTRAATELERRLIDRISREGPITFRNFMQAALYDPELGYYNTERLKIGAEGDYYTSSNVHPAFGAVLARAFAELWDDWTQPLTIVEIGPGSGQLASDVLSSMRDEHPALFERVSYVLVEASPAMRKRQSNSLTAFKEHLLWAEFEQLERRPIRGIVFSNEFFDALPVHLARYRNGSIEELFVTTTSLESSTLLSVTWGQPSTQKLSKYVDRFVAAIKDVQIIEINLDAIDWLERIARALEDGVVITIDYGDLAQDLYTPERRTGTLRCFYRHRLIDSPLERVGEQDITASVNFTALIEYGRALGLELVSFERQTAFLIRTGLIERIAELGTTETLEDPMERLAVKNLFVPGGLSDSFRVLIQQREPRLVTC